MVDGAHDGHDDLCECAVVNPIIACDFVITLNNTLNSITENI